MSMNLNSYRTEISIPVNKDSRTFEERHNEIFDKLEEKYSQPKVIDSSKIVNQESKSNKSMLSMNHDSFFDTDKFFSTNVNDWDSNVSSWLSNSRKKWNDEMNLLKTSMFSLESGRDEFDFNSWDPFKNRRRLDDFPKFGSEIQRESKVSISPSGNEQQMREMKQSVFSSSSKPTEFIDNLSRHQNELKPVYENGNDGQLYFKLRFESKNFKPEDIKITCSDSNLNICARKSQMPDGGPSCELQKSIFVPNCVDTQKFQCHLTQDGILILEAPVMSPDYSSLVPCSGNQGRQVIDRGSLIKIRNTTGPVVVADENGKRIHLEIQVDREYVPSDFSVTTDTNRISVKGRHEMKTATSSSFKEFSRFYEVPERIDPMSVTFNLVDGVLIIEALVA